MEAKQKAIQAAYGDAWEKVKEFVDKNGKCWGDRLSTASMPPEKSGFTGEIEFCGPISKHDYWRPKSLSGIEDNNGWIRTDESLPEPKGSVQYCVEGRYFSTTNAIYFLEMVSESGVETLTHWQPVVLPKPPIY